MPEIIFVKPAPGLRILDPATKPPQPLPAEGKRVEKSTHWLRRKAAGDVEFLPLPKPAKPAKPAPAADAKE